MTNFNDLEMRDHPDGGDMARIFFTNGYGASVIRFKYSYGGDKGLWELAVIQGNEDSWNICYDTPIIEDVLGHLTEDDVTELLEGIEKL